MKRAELFVPIVMAGAICLAQEVKQLPPAAGVTVPTGAGRGAGRGGFGGPIELGPDDKPAFPDPPAGFNVKRDNIPHGELTAVEYDSKSLGTRRRMRVYTPPGYSATRKYPVLYLLHGIGGTDTEWTRSCHANNIIDNLLAEGKIQPMVMVFPDGNSSVTADAVAASRRRRGARGVQSRQGAAPQPARGGPGRSGGMNGSRVGNAFRERLAEGHHPVHRFPLFRLSPTAIIARWPAFDGRRPDVEHRPGSPRDVRLGRRILLGARTRSSLRPRWCPIRRSAKQLKLLWLGCGNKDGLIRISQAVHRYLKENGVPHVWHVDGNAHDTTEWDNNLYLFSQRIFK